MSAVKSTFFFGLLASVGSLSLLASPAAQVLAVPETAYLHVYNWEDYVYESEEDGEPGLIEMFEDYVEEVDGVDLHVIYETFDTNETMYGLFETGSASYDLICPSDYMIQRMMRNGYLQPFANSEEERRSLYGDTYADWSTDYYKDYVSPYLSGWFDSITSEVPEEGRHSLNEYARGYMWGTLGIIYNPTYRGYVEAGLSEEDVKVQMNDWNSLWDGEAYKGTFQIKDSMRDTFSIGLMRAFDDVFEQLLSLYKDGTYTQEEYTDGVNLVFNNINNIDEFNALLETLNAYRSEDEAFRTDYDPDSIVDIVGLYLEELKANSYGLETDSGKTDIQNGNRSGICLAWSGDAVFAMDTAEEEFGNELYYAVPKTGGNIWFDGWVIPENASNVEYANKFIDFISRPEVAALNMDYIGYTPFIAGDDIVDTAKDWYDEKTWAIDEDPSLEETVTDWDEYAEENEWTKVDLSYFFEGTLSEDHDAVFYTTEIEEVTGLNLDGEEETLYAGRQFLAQYPTMGGDLNLDIIPGLAVMEDYVENNEYVLRMWESVKASGVLETWIVVLFCVEIGVALGLGIYFFVRKKVSLSLRKKRREGKLA